MGVIGLGLGIGASEPATREVVASLALVVGIVLLGVRTITPGEALGMVRTRATGARALVGAGAVAIAIGILLEETGTRLQTAGVEAGPRVVRTGVAIVGVGAGALALGGGVGVIGTGAIVVGVIAGGITRAIRVGVLAGAALTAVGGVLRRRWSTS